MSKPSKTRRFRAIRLDDQGKVDDVAVSGRGLFRLERMAPNSWWLAFYVGRKRVAFRLSAKKSRVEATVIEDELKCKDDSRSGG